MIFGLHGNDNNVVVTSYLTVKLQWRVIFIQNLLLLNLHIKFAHLLSIMFFNKEKYDVAAASQLGGRISLSMNQLTPSSPNLAHYRKKASVTVVLV